MKRLALCVLAATVMVAGCGKSEAEKQAEEAAKVAEQAAKDAEATAESAAKGLEAMAKGLEQLATGAAPTGEDGKPAEPVRFQDLIALLPEIDGWEQEQPTGERMTSPFPTANAKATYTKGDARIDVEVVDSGFNQLLLAPAMMFLQSGYSVENTSGYEKATTVNGQPGWEKWDIPSKSGEVNALVGKRFLVTIEGDNIDDTNILKEVASKIDFGRLAALK
ncbi:MAG TPA: hypothetical protein VGD94_23845 [Vicinamibacterales bacterium]